MNTLKPYIIPVISGYSFFIVQRLFWGLAIVYGPLAEHHEWFVSVMLPEHSNWYNIITYTRDILINILLVLPFALPFLKLNLKQKIIALLIVILPSFIYENRLIIFDFQSVHMVLFKSPGFYIGTLMSIGLLPLAIWFTGNFKRRYKVNEA